MEIPLTRSLFVLAVVAVSAAGTAWAITRPSNDRAWRSDQAVLAKVTFHGDSVHVENLRDYRYAPNGDVRPGYRDERYDLSDVERVWFVLVPFGDGWRGPAHAFLTFGFSDGRHLAVSVEARREEGEEYSVFKGMLKRFELIFVLGTEEDLIGLRAIVWNDPTHLYPVRASPDQVRALLTGLLERARNLSEEPEFYHTIGNNCTTNLVDQINRIASRRIRFGREILLPGYSDQLAYRMGLLDTELPLDEARRHFRINERARDGYPGADFSRRIREP
jgi:hypothetical protein